MGKRIKSYILNMKQRCLTGNRIYESDIGRRGWRYDSEELSDSIMTMELDDITQRVSRWKRDQRLSGPILRGQDNEYDPAMEAEMGPPMR